MAYLVVRKLKRQHSYEQLTFEQLIIEQLPSQSFLLMIHRQFIYPIQQHIKY